MKSNHTTVLLREAIDFLDIKQNGVYIDATFGNGGHSREMLTRCKDITLFCVDRDENVKENFDRLKQDFPASNLEFICTKFSNIEAILKKNTVNGIVFDFGVSSMQIDNPERGFSFQKDGKLSMQMGCCDISAYDFVNFKDEKTIADVIYKYSGEKKSRFIAKKIVENRLQKPIETTMELAKIVHSATGYYKDKIDPATRTFQAIRIFINEELIEIERAMDAIINFGSDKMRASCISFHSLEDSIIKQFITSNNGKIEDDFDPNYGYIDQKKAKTDYNFTLHQLHKGVITPSEEEIRANIRSRSAKMRSFELWAREGCLGEYLKLGM